MQTKLPTGIENFMKMRIGGFYYVDKTGLIRTLLENPRKVNLFTHPRRFGKTLNMSMLNLNYSRYLFQQCSMPYKHCVLTILLFHLISETIFIQKEPQVCYDYVGKQPHIIIAKEKLYA